MKKNTLYISTNRTSFHKSKVAEAGDKHNLRLDKNNPNFDPDLVKNNIFLCERQGEIQSVKPTDNNLNGLMKYQTKILAQEEKKYNEAIRENDTLSNEEKKKLSKERSKLKTSLNKWIDNPKTHSIEKEIFKKSISDLVNNMGCGETLLREFEQIENIKISRRNDKIKALSKLGDFKELEKSKNRNYGLKIKSTEFVFKIPDQNNINISAKDWEKIGKHFLKNNFPDNKLLYCAIHADENPNNTHMHIRISGFNNQSNDFDFPEQEMKIVKKHLYENGLEDIYNGRKWNQLSNEEHKKHGEIFQNYLFEKQNDYLKKLGYFSNFEKRTPEEIAEANHKYQQKISSTKREHNRQNKVKQIVEQAKNHGVKIIENNEYLKQNTIDLRKENQLEKLNLEDTEFKNEQADLELEKKKSKILEMVKLIETLPSKVFSVISTVKDFFNNKTDNEKIIKKEIAIENLSNHIDKIEEITDTKNTIELAENIVHSTETNLEIQKYISKSLEQKSKSKTKYKI